MAAKTRYFKIGLFILVGIALAVTGIVILKAGSLFQKQFVVETYFDESVQGLDIGAPFKHRGVKVGTVRKIDFVRNAYRSELSNEDLYRFGRYVMVRVTVSNVFPGMSVEAMEGVLKEQIDDGLRIRLATQGVTGVVHLEVDHLDAKQYPPMPIAWKPEYLYVPSAPSAIKVVGETLNNIAKDLEQAKISQVAADLDTLLLSTKQLIDETHMSQLSRQAAATLSDLQQTVKEAKDLLASPDIRRAVGDAAVAASGARRIVGDLNQTTQRVAEATDGLPDTVARLDKSIRRMDRLLASKSQDLEQTIENLRQISENVRDLTNEAKRYPSRVMFGEPPPRRNPGAKP